METRHVIAYAILALIVVMLVAGIRFAATSRRRLRARERRDFDRQAAALVDRDDKAHGE